MNNVDTRSWAVLEAGAGLDARIDDAGCPALSDSDLRRVFPDASPARLSPAGEGSRSEMHRC